jgi:23S rRNA (adenine2503-C2)-methyltransferase
MKLLPDIRSVSSEIIQDFLISKKEKAFRLKQISHWVWKQPVHDFTQMQNLSHDLRLLLSENFSLTKIEIKYQQISIDESIKIGFQLDDNRIVEGVLIPVKDRVTACISTQVGCRMGCKFCATGSLGFSRNLSVGEIYMQVFLLNKIANEHYKLNLSNIVVMGMGEPLDNYEATVLALRKIISEDGLFMSPRRITLSTCGIIPGIKRLAEEGLNIKLSVSLHAATDTLRNSLMPVNHKYPLTDLAESLREYYSKTKNRISYEYILFKDVNDRISEAKALAEFTKITPCKINLIEYNEVDGVSYKRSTEAKTQAFIKYLESKNLIVKLRRSRGSDVDAACGQLANKVKD